MEITDIICKDIPSIQHGNGVPMQTILQAESAIGVTFFEDFRNYLFLAGWIAIGPWELCGIARTIGNIEEQDLVSQSLRFRRLSGMHAVAICHDGAECFFVFPVSSTGVMMDRVSMRLRSGEECESEYNGMSFISFLTALFIAAKTTS